MVQGLSQVLSTHHNTPKAGDSPMGCRDSPHHSGGWTKWLTLDYILRADSKLSTLKTKLKH